MRLVPAGRLLALVCASCVACRSFAPEGQRSEAARVSFDDSGLAAAAPLVPKLVPLPLPPATILDFAFAGGSLYGLSRTEGQRDLWRWTRLDEPPSHVVHLDDLDVPVRDLQPDPTGARFAFRVVRPSEQSTPLSEQGPALVDVAVVEGATAALTWIARSAGQLRYSRFSPMVWSPGGDAIALSIEVDPSSGPARSTLLYTLSGGGRRDQSDFEAAYWRSEGLYLTRPEEDTTRGEWLPAFFLLRPGETTPVRVPDPPRIVSPDGRYTVAVTENELLVRSKDGVVRRFVATRQDVRDAGDQIKHGRIQWFGQHGLLLQENDDLVLDLTTMTLRRLLPEGRFRFLEGKHDGRRVVVETIVNRSFGAVRPAEKREVLVGEVKP